MGRGCRMRRDDDRGALRGGPDERRIGLVKEIFSSIPRRYDCLNHLLSFGQDIRWRNFAVSKMVFGRTDRLLDLATGTADLALAAARRRPEIRVAGLDFVSEMMVLGRAKIERSGLKRRISLIQGDAQNLPFPDASFDVAAIAFGIRNIPAKSRTLGEMTRVVVPGGQVLVLEMQYPEKALGRMVFTPYLNLVLPLVARFLSKNPAAYRYLADSIREFPSSREFGGLMSQAGLRDIEVFPLTFGITHLYLAKRGQT